VFQFIFLSAVAFSQTPDQILKMAVDTLPNKKLNVEFVVKVGIQNASSFKALEAFQIESESTALSSLGKFDWTFLANYNHLNQEKDVASPFEPQQIKQDTYGIGLKKYFSTGTAFETRLGRSYNEILFSTPGINIPKYEDTLSFTVSQNLWADALGQASRSELKALNLRSQAEQLNYILAQQQWAMDLIKLYNSAWLSQQQYFAAQENSQRRQKLVDITRSKVSKGTSERQDLLQVQSAELSAKNQFSKASTNLSETWKSLVVNLGLPIEWLVIPADKIPMLLDAPEAKALATCKIKQDESKTLEVQLAELNKKSAEENFLSASSQNKPKLQLVGGYNTNGIAATQNTAQEENFNADHPSWNVGLQLEIPLEGALTKSNRLRASAQQIRSTTNYVTAVDNKKIEFLTLCEKMKNLSQEVKNSEAAFKNQLERLNLEERRFRLGRTTTFAVIQAGDDKTAAEQQYKLSLVEMKNSVWEILKSTSELHGIVLNWVKTK